MREVYHFVLLQKWKDFYFIIADLINGSFSQLLIMIDNVDVSGHIKRSQIEVDVFIKP